MNEQTKMKQQQPLIFQQLQNSLKHQRLAHAYLFEGDSGTGKKAVGLWLAKSLLCSNKLTNEPCNSCTNCKRIDENLHPDVLLIQPDGQTIKVEQIRTLKAEFTKSGVETAQKIFLIQQAEKMSVSAANSLLKFLEEPEGQILAILTTCSLSRILPTIQSRCQILHFQPLAKKEFISELITAGIASNQAMLLSELTNSLTKAVEMAQDEWFNEAKEIIHQWFSYLIQNDRQAFVYVQKRMNKPFKEKEQQEMGFNLLFVYFQKKLKVLISEQENKTHIEELARKLELILQAKQKWGANVSWQSVCEQLVVRMIHP